VSEAGFSLHPRLAADTALLGDWPLSRVLLMNDEGWPWLILVPRRAGLREFHDLASGDLARLWAEIGRVSATLDALLRPTKMNVGMLGNLVPQMHIHVIARYETDEAWPGPVWGRRPRRPYAVNALANRAGELRTALGLS
jgi:diadenosine tetraphosphate (Ap4A) HIT family hydrolase